MSRIHTQSHGEGASATAAKQEKTTARIKSAFQDPSNIFHPNFDYIVSYPSSSSFHDVIFVICVRFAIGLIPKGSLAGAPWGRWYETTYICLNFFSLLWSICEYSTDISPSLTDFVHCRIVRRILVLVLHSNSNATLSFVLPDSIVFYYPCTMSDPQLTVSTEGPQPAEPQHNEEVKPELRSEATFKVYKPSVAASSALRM